MGLFAGLSQSDYQDVLRAIGRLMDQEGLCGLRLVEREDGMTLQVRPAADPEGGFETRHLGDEDLLALLRSAYAQHGTGGLRTHHTGHAGHRYQVVLRAIGRLLDTAGLRDVRLVERAGGMTLQAKLPGERRHFETFRLSDADLAALLENTLMRSGTGKLTPPGQTAGRRPLLPSKQAAPAAQHG